MILRRFLSLSLSRPIFNSTKNLSHGLCEGMIFILLDHVIHRIDVWMWYLHWLGRLQSSFVHSLLSQWLVVVCILLLLHRLSDAIYFSCPLTVSLLFPSFEKFAWADERRWIIISNLHFPMGITQFTTYSMRCMKFKLFQRNGKHIVVYVENIDDILMDDRKKQTSITALR